MLKILLLPFRLLKLLVTILELLAKELERGAEELERETAKAATRARQVRLSRQQAMVTEIANRERAEQEKNERELLGVIKVSEQARNFAGGSSVPRPFASPPRAAPPATPQFKAPTKPQAFSSPRLQSPSQPVENAPRPQAPEAAPILVGQFDPAPGPVTLVLFDLDGTLLDTDDLEQFRGRQHLGPQSQDYIAQLSSAYHRSSARNVYHPKHLANLAKEFPALRFGVFTRSPRNYANVLLNLGFSGWTWDAVVAFEDVARSKPHGDGVALAMRMVGLSDPRHVALVGDDTVDIQAAYNAGCLFFLETTSRSRLGLRALLEKVPDGILRGPATLARAIRSPADCLPALEHFLLDPPIDSAAPRFDTVPHFGGPGDRLEIVVLGRMFTETPDLANRFRWHGLTKSILDNKSSDQFPAAWTQALGAFLSEQLKHRRQILVTVVPAKNGRVPRMEHFLGQLSCEVGRQVAERCLFVPDVLRYAAGAQSHSGLHLNRQQRMANVSANLSVAREDAVVSRDVVVIDDVVTSGATLMYSHRRLIESGARSVTCVALAKAVRF